jgi:iron complex transport system substrate-binding protein
MKKIFSLCVLLFLIVTVSSCSTNNDDLTVTIVDMVGDSVEVPVNAKNVAVVARAAADMMIGFGLGDHVDGIYYSVLDNPWVELLYSNADGLYSYEYNESAELFISREVDLVIAPEQYIAEELRQAGVTAITVSLYGTPDYNDYLYYLSDIIKTIWPDVTEKVNMWQAELETALSDITTELQKHSIVNRSVYYVRGDKYKGIGYTDTGYSLLETIYNEYFNMTYLGREFESNKPSAEEIMLQNPDVVVIGGMYQEKLINEIKTMEPYKLLDAVQTQNIYNIPLGFVMWEQNSIALPLFVYDQANKLYPEYFNYDIPSLTKSNYETYFDIILSDEQVQYMLDGKTPDGTVSYEEFE